MSGSVGPVDWLQAWYAAQCDADWEHSWGIEINTLDNPGWAVRIDLQETALSCRPYRRESITRGDDDWLVVHVEDDSFRAACGPRNLAEVLSLFRDWAEAAEDRREPGG